MKSKNYLFMGACALALTFTSCSNHDENVVLPTAGDGSLQIVLAGTESTSLRATSESTPDENKINHFTVYVFDTDNNILEASVPGVVGGPTVVSGLSTGFSKKIVVVANQPSTFPIFNPGDDYEDFATAQAAISLSYQSPENVGTNGLVMYGEIEDIVLSPTGTNTVTVPVKRVAAKVTLGKVTLIPAEDYEVDRFELMAVSIQRAVTSTDIFGNKRSNTMWGGQLGSWNNAVQDFLMDEISYDFEVGIPREFKNFFYVLPNTDLDSCTLITLTAKYDGVVRHFPIRINDTLGSGNSNTDGTLINSNHSYVINLTINNLGEGTEDPDTPPETANLNVVVEVQGWELDIIQNVIW